MTNLDPKVWGPHYWFFLHTIALTYPLRPNAVIKKKYYEFIINLPLFLPNENISNDFTKMLDEYPVQPYLDSRKSFISWIHFIHNKINTKLEKPLVSLNEFYLKYYHEYKSDHVKNGEYFKIKQQVIYISIILTIVCVIYYLYDK